MTEKQRLELIDRLVEISQETGIDEFMIIYTVPDNNGDKVLKSVTYTAESSTYWKLFMSIRRALITGDMSKIKR